MLMITLILILGLGMTGCADDELADDDSAVETVEDENEGEEGNDGEDEDEGEDEALIPVDDLVADLQLRFAREADDDFTESLTVPRDHIFRFDLSPEAGAVLQELFENEEIDFRDMLSLYRDSARTQPIGFTTGGDSENFTYLSMAPPTDPIFYLAEDPNVLLEREEVRNDWGNAGQYFLAQYFDFETGEELERPLITVFTVETEIEGVPRIAFNMTDDGVAGLRWDPVPGAEEYKVLYIVESIDGSRMWRPMAFLDQTTETYWNGNTAFRLFMRGDGTADELYDAYRDLIESGEMTLEEFEELNYVFDSALLEENNAYVAVVALNSEGNSAVSNLIDIRDVAARVPMWLAYGMNEGGVISFDDVENSLTDQRSIVKLEGDVLLAPTHAWVIMGDGNATSRLINYNITGVTRGEVVRYAASGAPIFEESPDGSMILIPYTIEGTPFIGFVQLTEVEYDEMFEVDLQALAERQEALRSRGGDLQITVNLNSEADDEVDDISEDDKVATELRGDFDIRRASSPLSAYLAIQMLNSQTRISLDDFPEAADHEYLLAAWLEAALQNPLVLGPRRIDLDRRTGDLLVTYDHDAATQQRQQRAIIARVEEIVDEIIVDGMTDLEMQTAINEFLIEHATYDFGALDNAALNDFMDVDPEYYDSFTAYGILINGIGVCSGYADAFTLIADQAGLESVIVTGYLQGSLPHAWNRVNIEGEWYTLDVTNNDNEIFPNAFFNLSDKDAATILTEDNRWMLDREISRFVANSEGDVEYYRYRDRFFDHDEIVDALAYGIINHQLATYRTDVMLTEEQFLLIALEVAERTDRDLIGGHFLGIITLLEPELYTD